MTQLIVRNLDDEVRDRLRDRAHQHGRSMEEEVRDILRAAVVDGALVPGPQKFGTWCRDQFAGCHLDAGGEIPEWRGHRARPATFE